MLCEQKKICEVLEIIDAANSDRVANWPCYLSPLHRKQIKIGGEYFAAFFLFMETSPKDCALFGVKRKNIEIKDGSKIKQQTYPDRNGPRPIPNVCHLPYLVLITDYL